MKEDSVVVNESAFRDAGAVAEQDVGDVVDEDILQEIFVQD